MYGRKEKKLRKHVSLANEYLKYYASRSQGGKARPERDTWTKAQWDSATPTQRQLAKSGISYKKVKRMK